jgi:hypothetical protein
MSSGERELIDSEYKCYRLSDTEEAVAVALMSLGFVAFTFIVLFSAVIILKAVL